MKFRSWNRLLLVFGLAAGVLTHACQPDAERRLGEHTRRELELGRARAELWLTAEDSALQPVERTVAIGYLERLRSGLGSPFRLVDLALNDPRLQDSTRTRLAYALLARTMSAHTYEIDPIVLDRAGTLGVASAPGLGARHLQLIDKTIAKARDPLVAEAALRIAYTMAFAEGLVTREAPTLAGSVTSLRVDRALAQQDAAQLLASADESAPAPGLVRPWRDARRFRVEEPRLGMLSAEDEQAAIELSSGIVDALRSLGLELASRGLPAAPAAATRSHLTRDQARQLERAQARLATPPVTPLVIAARQFSRDAGAQSWLGPEERLVRSRFGNRAVNEESFVAALAEVNGDTLRDDLPARAALQAAVALRAYAQESVWFPGMDGPGARDLQERYGLGAITFDRTVPSEWRPYFRRMLARSLDDLYRVLPALNLKGLAVHFGQPSSDSDALALHEPGKRRLVLPPFTSAGTLAHEVAHDIDWQTALRRYRIRGDYATDHAARDKRDALAVQMRSLTSATLGQPTNARLSSHARRPAEVFARNLDWYVAVALAREGRRNGYLSSVQDELITGYGTVRPPDVSGVAGDVFMTILSQLAPVYREQRSAFRALYGSARTPRAYDLVRSVVETPLPGTRSGSFEDELEELRRVRTAALNSVSGLACAPTLSVPPGLQNARRQLVFRAAEARARGLAQRRLLRNAGADRARIARELYRGPAPLQLDTASTSGSPMLNAALSSFVQDELPATRTPFELDQSRECTPALLAGVR